MAVAAPGDSDNGFAVRRRLERMLYEVVEDPGDRSVDALRTAYEAELRAVVERYGVESTAAESGVDESTLEGLLDGPVPDLPVERAAAVLALRDDVRDPETVVAETRDQLMLGMTTAVVDVETVAANVDLDLTGQEVQQLIEGRAPMTLEQFAAIHRFVAGRA